MSRKLWMTLSMVASAAALVVGSASSARADELLKAAIPFDFIVGTVHLPAGDYVVTETNDPAIVTVASADGHHFAFVLTITGPSAAAVRQPELKFAQLSGEHFLSEINLARGDQREVPLTPSVEAREFQRVAAESNP